MAKKDKNDPSATSVAYDWMAPKWNKIDALLGGTDSMRQAEQLYLPQHTEETNKAYAERLQMTTLFNVTEMTLDSMVGRPFSNPVIKSDDMPEDIQEILENIDLMGNNIDVFARKWFRDGFAKGYSHVYVDFPRTPETNEDGTTRSVADDQDEQVRPYFVHIKPEDLIFSQSEVIDGREVLTQIRIMEEISMMNGFIEVFEPQIRVVTPGHVALYRIVDKRKTKKVWRLVEEYDFDLNFIPLVTFYATREDFMVSKPPLMDLADLNITHWQSTSDQRVIMTVSRFPMLAMTGVSDEGGEGEGGGKVRVGPHEYLQASDPNAKFYYVEPSGGAITAGREDLTAIEEQMSNYGAEFLKKKPGGQTATARVLDSSEATSPLQDMVTRFVDSLNGALHFLAIWINVEKPGELDINREFGSEEATQADLTELGNMRTRRDISQEDYVEEMKRRCVLRDSFDNEENKKSLESESFNITGESKDIDIGDE